MRRILFLNLVSRVIHVKDELKKKQPTLFAIEFEDGDINWTEAKALGIIRIY